MTTEAIRVIRAAKARVDRGEDIREAIERELQAAVNNYRETLADEITDFVYHQPARRPTSFDKPRLLEAGV